MHFCAGLPIILVGCKKDLRRDPKTIEELRKTQQRPVTPEEVSGTAILGIIPPGILHFLACCRVWLLCKRSAPVIISNAVPSRVKVCARYSSTQLAQRSCREYTRGARSVSSCRVGKSISSIHVYCLNSSPTERHHFSLFPSLFPSRTIFDFILNRCTLRIINNICPHIIVFPGDFRGPL